MQSDYPQFDRLYTELSRPLLAHAYGFVNDWHVSEDVTQKTWMRVYRYISKKGETPDTPYIYRMNKDSAYDFLRKSQRTVDTQPIDNTPVLPAVSPSVIPENESDLFREFWKQFAELELTPQDKEIFWLAERYDYTMQEISERVGIAKSTVNDRLRRLKQKCLEFLNRKSETTDEEEKGETSETATTHH